MKTSLMGTHTRAYLFSKSLKMFDGLPIISNPGLRSNEYRRVMTSSRAVKLYLIAPLGSTLQRGWG